MKTDYFGHDAAYKKRRAAGSDGWDPAEVSTSVLRQFARLLGHDAIQRTSRLIEFGCGAGNLSVGFAKLGFQVTGVDISPTAVEWARERANELGLELTFRVGNVVTIPDPTSSYSVAVDSHCLHCLVGTDRHAFLSNVRRLLTSDGVLVTISMCRNALTPSMDGFNPATGVIEQRGIATRFIGTREGIEAEILEAGFDILFSEVESDGEKADNLLVVAIPTREERKVSRKER